MATSHSTTTTTTNAAAAWDGVWDVIIIGAGMAGLRAAQVLCTTLPASRRPRILVLEARDVAGGRIRATHVPVYPGNSNNNNNNNNNNKDPVMLYIDEGAQYIQGFSRFRQHPIQRLARQHGITYHTIDWDNGYSLVGPQGRALSPALETKVESTVAKIWQQVEQWQRQQQARNPQNRGNIHNAMSIQDVPLQTLLQQFIQEHCARDATLSPAYLWTTLGMEIADDYGTDLHQLGATYFDQDDMFGSKDAVPHTYQALVEKAMLTPDILECIRFQHIVESVSFEKNRHINDDDYNNNKNDPSKLVHITCRVPHSDTPVIIQTRRVICTLPLGVLQQRHNSSSYSSSCPSLFVPPLPMPLQTAMQRLGYGCLEKVWLVFDIDKPFWPTDADAFYHFGTNHNDNDTRHHHQGNHDDIPFRSWFLPARVYRNPAYQHMLCCFVSGSKARALANLSATQVGDLALAALAQIFKLPDHCRSGKSASILSHVHVTKWSTDPWSGGGSYSHIGVGATAQDYRVWEHAYYENRLWFAGEATIAKYPSTVHGAYLSGERAARACLKTFS